MYSFSSRLAIEFRKHATGAKGEISLFRALIDSFNAMRPFSFAKEYHGTSHQVTFDEQRGAGRAKPKCELCDLMIIYYPEDSPSKARITFNQAKLTKKTLLAGPHDKFDANLEQWDLLCDRPKIDGVFKTFNPPKGLLQDGLLPSIGSYGVFYPTTSGCHDFAYYSADQLSPFVNSVSKSGALVHTNPGPLTRNINSYDEITATSTIYNFADALEKGLIGSPLQELIIGNSNPNRDWIIDSLNFILQTSDDRSEIIETLMNALEVPASRFNIITPPPAKAVIIIKTPAMVEEKKDE